VSLFLDVGSLSGLSVGGSQYSVFIQLVKENLIEMLVHSVGLWASIYHHGIISKYAINFLNSVICRALSSEDIPLKVGYHRQWRR
jgi:hypothetical protein